MSEDLHWFLTAAENDEGGDSGRRSSYAVVGVSAAELAQWKSWASWAREQGGINYVQGYSLNVRWIEAGIAEQLFYEPENLERADRGEWLPLWDQNWFGVEILDGADGRVKTNLDRVWVDEFGGVHISSEESAGSWAICTPHVKIRQLEGALRLQAKELAA
jgi:hypothetical protein